MLRTVASELLRAAALCAALCVSFLATPGAFAHLMPAGQGSLRIAGDSVFAVISVPVQVLSGFDADGDRLLSLAELNQNRDALNQQVSQLLDLRDAGQPGELLLADLIIPHLHDPDAPPATGQIVVMRTYRWSAPVQSLTLDARLFNSDTPALMLRAVQGERSEVVALSAARSEHRFFAGPLATFQRFVLLGAEHILAGFDHLLFLLTVLAAGAGWRYWLAIVTSFTVAHSLTLSLSVLGWVAVPSAVAEPLIAASIVLMALDNLRARAGSTARRAALVFACGLVHGAGFATALMELGGTGTPWLNLLGFNLGVELGQLLFVAACFVLLAALHRMRALGDVPRLVRVASVGAACIGAGILVQRLAELA
jgi:hypothetical protein